MILSVILAFLLSFQGRETSQTDRFAAGLLLASLIVIRGVPDRWTASVSFSDKYISRCSVQSAWASAAPLNEKLSTKVSVPWLEFVAVVNLPISGAPAIS